MGIFDIFSSKKWNPREVNFDEIELNLSDSGKESIRKFANQKDQVRMGDIMMLGDQGDPNFFYLMYYAVLFDDDLDVHFSALKRLPNFKDCPNFESLLEKLAKPNVGEDLEPYYSMMLSRLGRISKDEFERRMNGEAQQTETQEPLINIDEAVAFVKNNFNNPEETLWISDELNDPMGMNMTIIGDSILKAGYMPNGFDQQDGHRIYKYTKE